MDAKIMPFTRPAASTACRWSEAIESVTQSNIKIAFSWQRMWLRLLMGVGIIVMTTGCADTAVLRIVEYRGEGWLSVLQGQGIAVHQSGKAEAFANVQILYQGDNAVVEIDTKRAE